METNKEIIARLHERRGEHKNFIAMYVITAIVAVIAAIVFFCLKEIGAGFMCIAAVGMFTSCAMAQSECSDYCKCLISSMGLIDQMMKDIHVEVKIEQAKKEDDQPSES